MTKRKTKHTPGPWGEKWGVETMTKTKNPHEPLTLRRFKHELDRSIVYGKKELSRIDSLLDDHKKRHGSKDRSGRINLQNEYNFQRGYLYALEEASQTLELIEWKVKRSKNSTRGRTKRDR